MEQPSFAQHCAWQRRLQMGAGVKPPATAHHRIDGGCRAPKHFVCELAVAPFRGRIIGNDEEQVVVAVGPGIAARLRAEEINPFGTIRIDEAADDLGKNRIAIAW